MNSAVFFLFSLQCKPEYKVAGLYVVDSIVRQSRHQFGSDKDVFGPRFTKNITGTFENLCLCPVEDRVREQTWWQFNYTANMFAASQCFPQIYVLLVVGGAGIWTRVCRSKKLVAYAHFPKQIIQYTLLLCSSPSELGIAAHQPVLPLLQVLV